MFLLPPAPASAAAPMAEYDPRGASESRASAPAATAAPVRLPSSGIAALSGRLNVGDLVFIRIGRAPFRQIADNTGTWTNHVGIVVSADAGEVRVSESRVPFSGETSLSSFIARSQDGRVAVMRLDQPLTAQQQDAVRAAARRREGVLYDTGFDIGSRRQFCSRFVREVLFEATGRTVGEEQTLGELLRANPGADVGFWRVWYLGSIPWQRRTVTPASVLASPVLRPVFDGFTPAQATTPRAIARMEQR